MTPETRQTSFRLPASTKRQLHELAELRSMTLTQTIIVAIDRMYREEVAKAKK